MQPVQGIPTVLAWTATQHLECLNILLTLVCAAYNRQLLKEVICPLKNENIELESEAKEIAEILLNLDI